MYGWITFIHMLIFKADYFVVNKRLLSVEAG
jgi:hypothetical protein